MPPLAARQIATRRGGRRKVDRRKGGTISLDDGAQATLPPGSLTEDATVTFRTASQTPGVPVPSSILGQAYELAVDGADMTGVALVRLPLPPGSPPTSTASRHTAGRAGCGSG